jgi:integrase
MSQLIIFPCSQNQKPIASWIEEFERDYFTRRAKTPKSETTWAGDYLKVFRQLPPARMLTTEIVMELVTSTPADTKTRRRCCIALGALARFAGLNIDLKPFKGTYSPKKAGKRNLPTDDVISSYFEQIEHPAWRWAYGMLATYGLRPHELFHLDQRSLRAGNPVLKILDGKTGERTTFPYYPEWVERFELRTILLPQVSGKTNSDLGNRVTRAFQRYKVPFKAYDLRHCWAIRTLEFGLELSLAAQQMGHSVAVHTDLYHAWISERHQQRAFEMLMKSPSRPQAPL